MGGSLPGLRDRHRARPCIGVAEGKPDAGPQIQLAAVSCVMDDEVAGSRRNQPQRRKDTGRRCKAGRS